MCNTFQFTIGLPKLSIHLAYIHITYKMFDFMYKVATDLISHIL